MKFFFFRITKYFLYSDLVPACCIKSYFTAWLVNWEHLMRLQISSLYLQLTFKSCFLPAVNIPFTLQTHLFVKQHLLINKTCELELLFFFFFCHLCLVSSCLCSRTRHVFPSLSVCSQILSHSSLLIQSRNLVLISCLIKNGPCASPEKQHCI